MMEASAPFALTDDMKRVVFEQRLGFVATVCPDGTPNLSPKGTTSVWDDRHLVFADLMSPQTIRNLRENPWAEVNVVDPVSRRGYRFKGRCRILSGAEFERGIEFFEHRPRPVAEARKRIHNVVLVEVESAAPLTSPAYGTGKTEADLRREWIEHYRELWGDGP